jgi:hypothetical protein
VIGVTDDLKSVIFFERYYFDEVCLLYDLTHNFSKGFFVKAPRSVWRVVDDQCRSKSKSGETTTPYRSLGNDRVAL